MKKNSNKSFFLKYFDWNEDGITNWWEYCLPFLILLLTEITAELISNLIINLI